MKTRFFSLTALLFILFSPAFSAACTAPLVEEENFLSMSFENFDQGNNGWRQYSEFGCYHAAGILIDNYLNQNKTMLADWQIIAITWHAGQMYAFNNEYEIAKTRFENSINPNEPNDTPILWNDYVYATIAFLDHDLSKLKLHRDKIANGPTFNGIKTNLEVVDRLIQYFGQSYSAAYRQKD